MKCRRNNVYNLNNDGVFLFPFLVDHGFVAVFLYCSSLLAGRNPLSCLYTIQISATTCLHWCSLFFQRWNGKLLGAGPFWGPVHSIVW